jgi:CRISPR-associated protein Cas2
LIVLYVAAYDVSNDKVRLQMSHVLLRFGERVQESVFECRLSRAQIAHMLAECAPVLQNDETANLRVYPVCQTCQRRAIAIGAVTHARLEQPAIVI